MQSCAGCQLGTSCLKRQEHQMRQMAHKSWRYARGVNGRPSSGERTVSRWARAASAHTHDARTGDTLYWLTGVTEGDLGGKIDNGQVSTVHKDCLTSAAQSIPHMLELIKKLRILVIAHTIKLL